MKFNNTILITCPDEEAKKNKEIGKHLLIQLDNELVRKNNEEIIRYSGQLINYSFISEIRLPQNFFDKFATNFKDCYIEYFYNNRLEENNLGEKHEYSVGVTVYDDGIQIMNDGFQNVSYEETFSFENNY